ncbi:aldo/keto reductase [Gluconobacter frateurii]|uniref:aldo/keto reductase n=1 Tax=Gluconobacter frateurii TaxID=38308 RepID=UPI0030B8176B
MLHPASNASRSGTFRIGGDLDINRLGFGALRITGPGIWGPPADPDEAIRILRRLLELGVNFIDTADSYGEEIRRASDPDRPRLGPKTQQGDAANPGVLQGRSSGANVAAADITLSNEDFAVLDCRRPKGVSVNAVENYTWTVKAPDHVVGR